MKIKLLAISILLIFAMSACRKTHYVCPTYAKATPVWQGQMMR